MRGAATSGSRVSAPCSLRSAILRNDLAEMLSYPYGSVPGGDSLPRPELEDTPVQRTGILQERACGVPPRSQTGGSGKLGKREDLG